MEKKGCKKKMSPKSMLHPSFLSSIRKKKKEGKDDYFERKKLKTKIKNKNLLNEESPSNDNLQVCTKELYMYAVFEINLI